MSSAAGRINSSSIVKVFLALAIQLANEYALSADTFDEVLAFSKCFCSSCSHFFLLKNSKGLLFNAWCLAWQSSFKGFMLSWIASHHILHTAGLENVNHLLQ